MASSRCYAVRWKNPLRARCGRLSPSDGWTVARHGAPDPALEFARWILYEEPAVCAVNKPAGVLSQGGEGGAGSNLVDLARAHFKNPKIGVAHRLDRNVSGVVLLSRDGRFARAFAAQLEAGRVERVY